MSDQFRCCGSGNCCPPVKVVHDKDAVDNENVQDNNKAVMKVFGLLACQCKTGGCSCGAACPCELECVCGCYTDD